MQQWVVFLSSRCVSLSTIWISLVCMRSARHFCRILKASNVKSHSSPSGSNRFYTCGRRDGEIWRIQWALFATCTSIFASKNRHHLALGFIQLGLFLFAVVGPPNFPLFVLYSLSQLECICTLKREYAYGSFLINKFVKKKSTKFWNQNYWNMYCKCSVILYLVRLFHNPTKYIMQLSSNISSLLSYSFFSVSFLQSNSHKHTKVGL